MLRLLEMLAIYNIPRQKFSRGFFFFSKTLAFYDWQGRRAGGRAGRQAGGKAGGYPWVSFPTWKGHLCFLTVVSFLRVAVPPPHLPPLQKAFTHASIYSQQRDPPTTLRATDAAQGTISMWKKKHITLQRGSTWPGLSFFLHCLLTVLGALNFGGGGLLETPSRREKGSAD